MMILRSALSSSSSSSSSSRTSALLHLHLLGRRRAAGRTTTTTSSSSKRLLATTTTNNARGVVASSPATAPRRRVRPTTTTSSSSSSSADCLFTPSPFARSSRIIVDEEFEVVRELMEDPNNAYGARRYLLLPIHHSSSSSSTDHHHHHHNYYHYSPDDVVASLNANRNVLFGARLHRRCERDDDERNDERDDDGHYSSRYLAACGALLDVAREDASINGQQVQALAALDGLCAWVTRGLERRVDDDDGSGGGGGGGSDVLAGLMMRGGGGIPGGMREEVEGMAKRTPSSGGGKRRANNPPIITTPSSLAGIKNDSQRMKILEAVRSIATGRPRPGHSVLGAGTYRDGMTGWTALAREYARLATATAASSSSAYDDDVDDVDVDSAVSDESSRRAGWGRPRRLPRGPLEVALYASRGGEVTKIEHLAHTTPEYLREAGGAMARMFFV